jgi:predicted RNA-binding Zn-ribbon protein involved in translation (DUF1610 family)
MGSGCLSVGGPNLLKKSRPNLIKEKNRAILLNRCSNIGRIMAADKICSSCGKRLIGHGNTFFKCPKCGEYEIGRCDQCRDQGVPYECKKCGFIGP